MLLNGVFDSKFIVRKISKKVNGVKMKTERNILIAFILNLLFSAFEFFGGIFTGSVAVLSDALHDLGDAMSIGVSYFLEKKSKRKPDDVFTNGYARYSVLGSLITTVILLCGSCIVIYNAVLKLIHPAQINYDGMILFAVVGVIVNSVAAFFTREGDSLNQKAVNLHMLEDVLGWIVVLVGAVVMRFTDFTAIDPIMSIGVALFIFKGAVGNMKEILNLFLEKAPEGVSVQELKAHLTELDGVLDVHHVHLWSVDGHNHFATMHVVTESSACEIKDKIRAELREHGIVHATLELEQEGERCHEEHCHFQIAEEAHQHHHHHHHHHHPHHHHHH